MLCRDVRAMLPGLVSDDLPDARATVVRGHLTTCADCRQLLTGYRQDRQALGAFLRSAEWSPAPNRRWESVPPPRHRAGLPGWPRALAGTLVLVLLTGVVTFGVYALFGGGGTRGFAASTPVPSCGISLPIEPGNLIAAGYQPEEVQRFSQPRPRTYPCDDETAATRIGQELAAESQRLLAEGPFTQAWRELAQEVSYPLFRPANVPSYLTPGDAPREDTVRTGGVVVSYRSPGNPSALVIIEGAPPALQEYDEGESILVGQLAGRYRDHGTTRWLVFQRESTRIVLQEQSEEPQIDLYSIALGMLRVPTAPESCAVTPPPIPAFVPLTPPGQTPPILYSNRFWYGSGALRTQLPADGTWRILRDKSFWWREGYSAKTEPQPPLILSGRRLDGEAPPFTSGQATNAFASDIGMAMLTMVDLPTPGCWEITAKYGQSAEVTFVVWVEPGVR